ncbi:MAG: hypothetical protein ACXABX_02240 [Candidatus Thorarchaeota archaeon]|jgi:hypothetical protein
MGSPNESKVVVWMADNECELGSLRFSREGASAVLDSGKIVIGQDHDGVTYSVNSEVIPKSHDQRKVIPLQTELRVSLDPYIIVERPYTFESGPIFENIFPPSTLGLYNRITFGKKQMIFTVQNIMNDSRLWLTISDPYQNVMYEAHRIQPYEAEFIQMFENGYFDRMQYKEIGSEESAQSIISRFLEVPPPTWKQIAKLVSDVSVPNLRIKDTMRETISQLVPISFPEQIRDELMAFLAFVVDDEIPNEDPVEYSIRLLPVAMFGSLLRGHLRCIIDKTSWPSYVKYMTQAARGQLESPKRSVSADKIPWLLFWRKCLEVFPSWLNEAILLAKQLNIGGKIPVGLPVSKAAAKRSRRLWKQRLAALTYDLRIRGHVNQSVFGLTDMVYLGSAYRWPHRHMKFITQLGESADSVSFLQVLTTPLSVVERMKRVLPGIFRIGWSTRHSNLDLFNRLDEDWKVQEKRIINSIQRKRSLGSLRKHYGPAERSDSRSMSAGEAKVCDLVATGIDLADLESVDFMKFWNLSTKQFKKVLKNFIDRELIRIQYDVSDNRLVSIATIAQGPPRNVISLVAAFLENTPTSLAMVSDDEKNSIIVSKVSESSAYEIASNLPKAAYEQDMQIRCLRSTSFQSYTYNLFQRLLNKDGTWDDDVSAFLSQARSKRKELSESNA